MLFHLHSHHPDDIQRNEQLVRLLADLRVENRQLCTEIVRLRQANHRLEDDLAREMTVRFGRAL